MSVEVAGTGNGQLFNAGAMVSLVVPGNAEAGSMQVLCKSTNGNAETHCCVCGQGFVMFWERQSRAERIQVMKEIQNTPPASLPERQRSTPDRHVSCSGMD